MTKSISFMTQLYVSMTKRYHLLNMRGSFTDPGGSFNDRIFVYSFIFDHIRFVPIIPNIICHIEASLESDIWLEIWKGKFLEFRFFSGRIKYVYDQDRSFTNCCYFDRTLVF